MVFPPDTSKTSDLNILIKCILNKKLNHRVCSFNKLKSMPFFYDFNWDDLIDFKLNPPFIPEVEDMKKQMDKFTNYFDVAIKVI